LTSKELAGKLSPSIHNALQNHKDAFLQSLPPLKRLFIKSNWDNLVEALAPLMAEAGVEALLQIYIDGVEEKHRDTITNLINKLGTLDNPTVKIAYEYLSVLNTNPKDFLPIVKESLSDGS